MSISPNGTTIATAGKDNTIKIWDILSGKEIQKIGRFDDYISGFEFSPSGQLLATASDDTVKIWEVMTGREQRTLYSDKHFWCFTFSPDGMLIATGADTTIILWDVSSGAKLGELIHKPDNPITIPFTYGGWTDYGYISDVAFSPNGRLLAAINSTYRTVRVWDLVSRREVLHFALEFRLSFPDIAFSPGDGRFLVVTSYKDGVRSLDYRDISSGEAFSVDSLSRYAFSPDGKYLAMSGMNDTIVVRSLADRTDLLFIPTNSGIVSSLAFSPDGEYLANGGTDKKLKLWNARTWKLIMSHDTDSEYIYEIQFTSNGEFIATHGSDKKVIIWRKEG